jgi:transposase
MVAFKFMVILEVSFATIEEIFSDTSIVVTFKAYFGFAQH